MGGGLSGRAGLGEKEALMRYLSDKLDNMRSSDRAQLTMVCTWLTEMYLDKLNGACAAERPDQYQLVSSLSPR